MKKEKSSGGCAYKKGGKVANMDTMRLELSKKTKKA